MSLARVEPLKPLLRVEGLTSRFQVRSGRLGAPSSTVYAAEDVSFSVGAGEIVGLIGESGSGKTTVGRTIVRLEKAVSGAVYFNGRNALAFEGAELKAYRREVQVIFQDPAASLDPLMRVKDLVAEPLAVHKIGNPKSRPEHVAGLLRQVGLSADAMRRYPHEFSGGQRQRIAIARALAVGPQLIVADEPVSALDVSIQAQVINLLQELRQGLGLALLFISHDLATVEFLCDRVVVMYRGRVVEIAPAADFQRRPLHPYSKMLVDDAPHFGAVLRGSSAPENEVALMTPPAAPLGCAFYHRCPQRTAECAQITPRLAPVTPDRAVACLQRNSLS